MKTERKSASPSVGEESNNNNVPPTMEDKRGGIEQPDSLSSKSSFAAMDSTGQNLATSSRPLLTPHTLRLLKLIEEGSSDHARMAVDHLKVITANSSARILWEILGRLQAFLVSPEWSTRSNAGLAMEGVAQHLPVIDQEAFLSQDNRYHFLHRSERNDSTEAGSSDSALLKISDLEGNLSTVLEKGQLLVAAAESRYQVKDDEEQLQLLDESYQGAENFCKARLEVQRRILTKRLGLSVALAHYTTDCDQLKNQLIDRDDIQVTDYEITSLPDEKNPRPKKKFKRGRKASNEKRLAIGALLTMEIWQQEHNKQCNEYSSSVISHRSAQSILAGELMFRMFDSSWHVRHGSLIGILSLIRAWKAHSRKFNDSDLGVWPHDILARTLCVLALDRFGDFSGASTESISGSMVAPIREMAGQVFAVVFLMSPNSYRQKVVNLLEELIQHNEWETRHGAFLAMKYIVVLAPSTKPSDGDCHLQEEFQSFFLDLVIIGLKDESDDVQGVAAQILSISLQHVGFYKTKKMEYIHHIVQSLWESLENIRDVSSSVNDLVQMLSILVRMNAAKVLEFIPNTSSPLNALVRLNTRMNELLQCEFVSVKTSILCVIRSLSNEVNYLLDQKTQAINKTDKKEVQSSYCSLVKNMYDLYCEVSLTLEKETERENDWSENSDLRILYQSCTETWKTLSESIGPVLRDSSSLFTELYHDLIMEYFDAKNIRLPLKAQMDRASVISLFFISGKHAAKDPETEKSTNHHLSILEFFILSHLDSPLSFHYGSACILVQALFKTEIQSNPGEENVQLTSILELCTTRLVDKLQGNLSHDLQKNWIDTTTEHGIIKTITDSVCVGYKMICQQGQSGKLSADTVVELWKEVGLFSKHDYREKVTVDSMRLATQTVGTLIAGGIQSLPKKLTPIIRPLMTSIQNERDEKRQMLVCSYMGELLVEMLSESESSERFEGLQKTLLKVVKNLCNFIIVGNEPSCSNSSTIIGMLVSKLPERKSLQEVTPLWKLLVRLQTTTTEVDTEEKIHALFVLKAACRFLDKESPITVRMFDDFAHFLVYLGCSEVQLVRIEACDIIQSMCSVNMALALKTILPSLVLRLRDDKNDNQRSGACILLQSILKSSKATTTLCPYVKSLLPIVMSMMIDPVELCAEIAARIFSLLVQVAPLVTESVNIAGLERDDEANLVIDHLIHGKKLHACEIHPYVAKALREGGVVLRNYQREGVSWLRFLQRIKLNGALCDSMGLGKTLQALLAVSLAHMDNSVGMEHAKSLVVCPASIVGHWVNEVHRYFPRNAIFRPSLFMGDGRQLDQLESCNLIVTSYEVLRSSIDTLSKLDWTYCILDEGHLLKNPKTATAKASRRLRARHKLILTGTPIQNSVNEIWATFDFLMPSFLGSSSQFSKEFARPIAKGQNLDAAPADIAIGMEKLKLLHQQVLPFILRREKEQVLTELPPKVITRIPCPMSSIQEDLYNRFCSDPKGKLSISTIDRMINTKHEPETENTPAFNTETFRALLYLRLLCTHPWLVKPTKGVKIPILNGNACSLEASGKLVALRELLRDAGLDVRDLTAADNDTSLIYCEKDEEQTSDMDDHEQVLAPDTWDSSEKDPRYHRSESQESRCLIFAQFTHSLDIVEELLIKRHMPSVKYLRLDGKVPVSERASLVEKFNRDDSFKLMLLTTKIGGLGLNLTGADTVIFLEHDWNPHSDLQAMDRAHRIGQKRTVHVYQLVTMNSIEEKTMLIQERKLAMSKAIINTDNSSMYSMGTDRLLDIFQFRSESSSSRSPSDLDNTLDALVERYQAEYQSLSLNDFLSGFERLHDEITPSDIQEKKQGS